MIATEQGRKKSITPKTARECEALHSQRETWLAHRIPAREALDMAGLTLDECSDVTVPACCSAGCEVEPDGHCEHGCCSVLLAYGMV